jgi:diaminopimelate decarboxylase
MSHPDPALLAQVERLLQEEPALHPGELTELVREVLEHRRQYLEAARQFGTPQYLFEEAKLQAQIARFTAAFTRPGQVARVHYAFKSNPSLCVVQAVQRSGLHADVSSGLELELALRCGFDRIVLSGPAKTDAELQLALQHAERVTVHLDSGRELERLEDLAVAQQQTITAGIRLSTQGHGLWTKFGVPVASLPEVMRRSASLSRVRLQGVQFHLSWNRGSAGYLRTLAELGPILAAAAPSGGWRFVDIGGGYYPEDDEGVYPWLTRAGRLRSLLGVQPADGPPNGWDLQYLLHQVQPIEDMAGDILQAFRTHVAARGPVELWLEPGRYLVNKAVHLLLSVADCKGAETAITDGGTNLLGWERLETEHCPLLNLSRPGPVQKPCRVYGSLCTPHDLWGYAYYGADLQVGDVLMLPAQGSYVQTLSQRFIKPVCQTVALAADGGLRQVERAETLADRYPQLS